MHGGSLILLQKILPGPIEVYLLDLGLIFFLISSSILKYVKYASHVTAHLSDHKLVAIKLSNIIDNPRMRGYWKLNNKLLQDKKLIIVSSILPKNYLPDQPEIIKKKGILLI